MSDRVQFDDDRPSVQNTYNGPSKSRLARWMVSKGLSGNERQANYILMVVILVCIAAVILIWNGSGNASSEAGSRPAPYVDPMVANQRAMQQKTR